MSLANQVFFVVVIGMHRSGTSAIARGLQVIGVELGDNLLSPGEDNEKGFWEDQDIVLLNENLLKAIGHEWYDLRAITCAEVDFLCDHGFLLQAIELLRNKSMLHKTFGFKDPRIAKLIAFWVRVFEKGGLQAKYVLSLRNPLSIAKSLEQRNKLDRGVAFLLWTEHMLASLSYINPIDIIVVDYDKIINNAEYELDRIANWLGLDISSDKLYTYRYEFLEKRLRHSLYKAEDFYSDNSIPPISHEIYRFFIGLINGQESFEHVRNTGCLKRWIKESDRMQPVYKMIDRHQRSVIEITEIENELADKTSALSDYINKISQQIGNLEQVVSEHNHRIAEYQASNNHLKQIQNDFTFKLSQCLNSNSWRLTEPLRVIGVFLRQKHKRIEDFFVRFFYVANNEGFNALVKKSISYLLRGIKRRLYSRRFARLASTVQRLDDEVFTPLVSFVIPVYDRTDVLRSAINSALNQSMQVFEVIIVTDGSPTETLQVIDEYSGDPRVKIFHYPQASGNAVRGRNKGILESQGEYIAFLDSDDYAVSNRLELCLPFLESGEADVVYGGWRALLDGTRSVDNLRNGQEVYSPDCVLKDLVRVCVPCQSTVMVRREFFFKAGFLKPQMKYREDHELWARLAFHGAIFKSIPYILTELRLHSGNNELNFKDHDSHWESLLGSEYRSAGPIPKKIYFLVGDLGISGGLAVVLRYVTMLMIAGHDAAIIDLSGYGDVSWFGNPGIPIIRFDQIRSHNICNIDILFATFWSTVQWLERIPAKRKLYLVQSDERLFYEDYQIKNQVESTYKMNYEYVTIAKWISNMLHIEFSQLSKIIPNGIDTSLFFPGHPLETKKNGRLRVLLEGPISVPFKGVKDAYEAVSGLDCELWIVSSHGEPAKSWKYDRFFSKVSQQEMRAIYSSCDIMVKLSRVESFAYPPLEAMACGCAVVLGLVDGGIEYAIDGFNVIFVPQGDLKRARTEAQRLLLDEALRESLVRGGFETVKKLNLDITRKALLDLIDGSSENINHTVLH